MSTTRASGRGHIQLKAAEWFTSMQAGNVSAAERARFSEWLAESAAHVEEYLKIASVWRQLGEAKVRSEDIDALLAAAREDGDAGNVVRFHGNGQRWEPSEILAEGDFLEQPSLSGRPPERRDDVSRRPTLRWAAAMLLSVAVTYSAWFAIDRHIHGIRYRTDVGQQMTFALADGSVILLNTRSEVRVRMSDSERRVNLVSGEAMFEVAKDRQRPFRVQAGRSVVEAVGTVFNVYRQKNAATVTVLEGKVIVATSRDTEAAASDSSAGSGRSPPSPLDSGTDRRASSKAPTGPGHATAVATLSSNEQVQISPEGSMQLLRRVSAERVSAWTNRRLIFEDATLADIVSEFNRYNVTRLRVDDAQLAAIRINAMFNATDPDSLIEYLKKAEGVSVERLHDGTSVLYRDPPN